MPHAVTALYSHSACLRHDTGAGHPERADRLRAVLDALEPEEFADLVRLQAPCASFQQIDRAHVPGFAEALLDRLPKGGNAALDADTIVSPGSGEAALRAAGAVCAAVDGVMAGEFANAFCAVRPPGHHAEPDRPMGFCLFNNIAIGALHARAAYGVERIAVVDFDVHHGNGTQAMFESDPGLFYGSTHQWPLYPGTGAAVERGVGNIVNVPLAPKSGSAEFRSAFEAVLLPALDAFRPELLLVSAGFDAHAGDPLASLQLQDADYFWVTARLAELAGRHGQGRLVSALEGGYSLHALASATQAHVRALMQA